MRELDQSVFDGQPSDVTLACVDYDGLLKFGTNVRNYRYTWASERWRGADWVEKREGTDYKPLTSIRRVTPNAELSGGEAVRSDDLLAPCPFCGSTDIRETYYEESDYPTTLRSIGCSSCGCELHGTQDDKGTMRNQWNHRANVKVDRT